jgi:hypothetical protein
MFKKFAILLTPFLFAPISLSLTNSAAHAQTTTRWTGWGNCRFTYVPNNYSEWRAFVQYRTSDNAARVVRIEFKGDEPIHLVEAWISRDINGSRHHVDEPKLSISAGDRTAWVTSPAYYGAPYASNLYPRRYANVMFKRTDRSICTGEVGLP